MNPPPGPEVSGIQAGEPGSAAELFAALWNELVTVLGTTAAATLIRRAVKRAGSRVAGLRELDVTREGWDYRYTLPAGWEGRRPAEVPELADLVAEELVPLLREFTGHIVLRRLRRVPALRELGLPAEET